MLACEFPSGENVVDRKTESAKKADEEQNRSLIKFIQAEISAFKDVGIEQINKNACQTHHKKS